MKTLRYMNATRYSDNALVIERLKMLGYKDITPVKQDVDTPVEPDADISKMTKAELVAHADMLGVETTGRMTKAEIMAVLMQ